MTFVERLWRHVAAHHRYRDEYALAYRVMRRYPVYSVAGAARHHELNGDVFDKDLLVAELASALRETGVDAQENGDRVIVTGGRQTGMTVEQAATIAKRMQDAELAPEIVMVGE